MDLGKKFRCCILLRNSWLNVLDFTVYCCNLHTHEHTISSLASGVCGVLVCVCLGLVTGLLDTQLIILDFKILYSGIAILLSLQFTTGELGFLGPLSCTGRLVPTSNGGCYLSWVPKLSPYHRHRYS